MAAGTRTILAAEEPRARRRRLAAGVLADYRIGVGRPGALLRRRARADSDVLGDLFDDLDHRGPAGGFSAVDDGVAGAAHEPGAGKDSRIGYAGVDPGPDLSRLRAAGRRPGASDRADPDRGGDFFDLVHADRSGICGRVADALG